jgi:hypothetical protein
MVMCHLAMRCHRPTCCAPRPPHTTRAIAAAAAMLMPSDYFKESGGAAGKDLRGIADSTIRSLRKRCRICNSREPPPVPTRNSVGTGRTPGWRDRRRRHADPGTATAGCCSRLGQPPPEVDVPRRTTPAGGVWSMASRAMIRRRDVRSHDAGHRGAGLARRWRRSAVAPPVGRAHPCPARGAITTSSTPMARIVA